MLGAHNLIVYARLRRIGVRSIFKSKKCRYSFSFLKFLSTSSRQIYCLLKYILSEALSNQYLTKFFWTLIFRFKRESPQPIKHRGKRSKGDQTSDCKEYNHKDVKQFFRNSEARIDIDLFTPILVCVFETHLYSWKSGN